MFCPTTKFVAVHDASAVDTLMPPLGPCVPLPRLKEHYHTQGDESPHLGGHAGTTEFTDEVIRRTKSKLEVWSTL